MRLVVWAKTWLRMPESATSNSMTTSRPTAITSSVVMPRWTSTLSITTWKNNGVTKAKSCRTKETSSTSPSSLRYLTTAGMNQVKSNFARSPASEAREVSRISSPLQRVSKSANDNTWGRSTRGSWIRTFCSSTRARMTKLPSFSMASAGSGVCERRATSVATFFALSPSCFAASRICGTPKRWPGSRKSWASWSASAAMLWKRASMTRPTSPLSGSGADPGG
jgi:hypothetical protein